MADLRVTALLDDFNWGGSDENPISHGGAWANLDARWNGLYGGSAGSVAANNFSWSYWTAEAFSGDQDIEVWGLASGGDLGAAGEGWRLGMWQDVGGSYAADGYGFGWYHSLGDNILHRRYSNSDYVADIGSEYAGFGGSDRYMLLRRSPAGYFELYASDTADPDAAWSLMADATDTTYTGPFYLGLCAEDPTAGGVGWSAFGGGRRNRPQMYRWIKN